MWPPGGERYKGWGVGGEGDEASGDKKGRGGAGRRGARHEVGHLSLFRSRASPGVELVRACGCTAPPSPPSRHSHPPFAATPSDNLLMTVPRVSSDLLMAAPCRARQPRMGGWGGGGGGPCEGAGRGLGRAAKRVTSGQREKGAQHAGSRPPTSLARCPSAAVLSRRSDPAKSTSVRVAHRVCTRDKAGRQAGRQAGRRVTCLAWRRAACWRCAARRTEGQRGAAPYEPGVRGAAGARQACAQPECHPARPSP